VLIANDRTIAPKVIVGGVKSTILIFAGEGHAVVLRFRLEYHLLRLGILTQLAVVTYLVLIINQHYSQQSVEYLLPSGTIIKVYSILKPAQLLAEEYTIIGHN
jgi:hypothetical protein